MWDKVTAAEKSKSMLDLTTIPGMQTADRYLKVIGTRLRGNDYTKLRFRREMFALILRCTNFFYEFSYICTDTVHFHCGSP